MQPGRLPRSVQTHSVNSRSNLFVWSLFILELNLPTAPGTAEYVFLIGFDRYFGLGGVDGRMLDCQESFKPNGEGLLPLYLGDLDLSPGYVSGNVCLPL